jgi:hypothetical protein
LPTTRLNPFLCIGSQIFELGNLLVRCGINDDDSIAFDIHIITSFDIPKATTLPDDPVRISDLSANLSLLSLLRSHFSMGGLTLNSRLFFITGFRHSSFIRTSDQK